MGQKKKLTRQEEFEIMKLVLDKFLWAGILILLFGFYRLFATSNIEQSLWIMAGGGVVLLIFMGILVKEYEFVK